MQSMMPSTLTSLLLLATSTAGAAPAVPGGPELLAASFGADNFGGLAQCAGAPGDIDGLPVVFDAPLDIGSVDPTDFRIVTSTGAFVTPQCATFFPSVNADERRTILTQGAFGSPGASPLRVEIVGSIQTADGSDDYQGNSIDVVPWETGAILVYARNLPVERLGGLDQCPQGTEQIVQLAFGSNAGNQFPQVEDYLQRFQVVLEDNSTVSPFAFADTTVDNYLELCLATSTPARIVDIDAFTIKDASGQRNQTSIYAALERVGSF